VTKNPDTCSVSRCRKIADYTIEGKGFCEEHVGTVHDTKLAKFKEDQARTRTFHSFYEEGVYLTPNPKKYGWCE
jgi:hypothetical protein